MHALYDELYKHMNKQKYTSLFFTHEIFSVPCEQLHLHDAKLHEEEMSKRLFLTFYIQYLCSGRLLCSSDVFFTNPGSVGLTAGSEKSSTAPQVCTVSVIRIPLHSRPENTTQADICRNV